MESFYVVPKTLFVKLVNSSDNEWNKIALRKHIELKENNEKQKKIEFESDNLKNMNDFPQLLSTIPSSAKTKVERLLYELNSRGISWDSKTGSLQYKNKPMKTQLKIKDLLHYLGTQTGKIQPHIVKELLLLIEKVGIGKNNIVNNIVKRQIYMKPQKDWDVYQ